MIRYNVVPYRDEILYSQIARLFDHVLESSVSHGLVKLFGNYNYKATIDLPNHLDSLFSNYYYRFEDSVDSIIWKYTLYPFYEPFFRMNKRTRVLTLMKGFSGSLIHIISGINTSRLERSRYPKYCPQCILDSRTQLREPYWQRVHQVPGLIVCPIHNVFINEYRPSFEELNQSMFIPAERLSGKSLTVTRNKNNTLFMMSKMLDEVLNHRLFFDVNTVDYKDRLKNSIYKKGSIMNYSAFVDDLTKYYGLEALKIYFPSYKAPLQWIPTVVRKPSECFDPIKHLLLNNFMSKITYKPQLFHDSTWDGPWKCVNPICSHYQKACIQSSEVFYCHILKRTAALIKCDCGMVYKVSMILNDGVKHQSISIKDYGSLWRNRVLDLQQKGKSISAIAGVMQTSHGVISRFLNKDKSIELRDLKFQNELLKKRGEWTNLLESFDEARIVNARNANNKLYMWLHYHDLPWLQVTHKLYAGSPTLSKLRLEWEKIDEELVSRISETVDELKANGFKGRITTSLISKLIKVEKNYTRINSNKIPNAICLLEKVTEPMESYQLRRLNDSIVELKEKQEKLTVSKVIRNSGLKTVDNHSILEFVQNEVLKACL